MGPVHLALIMKTFQNIALAVLLLAGASNTLSSCKTPDVTPAQPSPTPPPGGTTPPISTPATAIPAEMVGTWFAVDNKQPLTTHWDQKTFLGELGFRDFRTMVFTADGQNAVEYSTFSVDVNGQTTQRFYKFTGTLEYKPGATPRTLTFHAQSGVMRVYKPQASTYQESPIIAADVAAHHTVWQSPNASSFATGTNYLDAQRLDGSVALTAKYQKIDPNAPQPAVPTTTPPTSGTYVKVGSLYYRTAVVGNREWTTLNYAGPGGLQDPDKPYYGTYLKQADLGSVPVPAGWRLPSRQDIDDLLASRGVALEPWNMTPDDHATTLALGPLQATTNWRRVDPWATNATGFNALPGNLRSINPNHQGEGSNFLMWTSEQDSNGRNLVFKIIQMTSTTYASLLPFAPGTVDTEVHIPVRFVRNK